MTTVGYGDITPSHTQGRVIATLVMLAGIGFLAVVTASITAALVENARADRQRSGEGDGLEELREINSRLKRLETEIGGGARRSAQSQP